MSARASGAEPRLGLDVAPARHPLAGVGVYVTELAAALDALAPGRVVRLGMRSERVLRSPKARPGDSLLRGRHHLAWILRHADRDAGASRCGLVHYTNAVAPLRATVPFVLTIHDLSVMRWPASHPTSRLATVPFAVAAARRARLIIVPSAATAEDVRRLLRVRSDRIVVIPHAARAGTRADPDESILMELGLEPGGYIMALGTVEPRKNHVGLLAAFERVAASHHDLRLVLVGGPGWRGGKFRRALAESRIGDRVVLAGRQPDGAVAALLASCAVMAYPSLYEGFGLPVLEAMAAGAPVVTSSRSSLPEVAGGAAVLVDPTDVASIADGILEALDRRTELAAAGRSRAGARTWLDVGSETLAVYETALRG